MITKAKLEKMLRRRKKLGLGKITGGHGVYYGTGRYLIEYMLLKKLLRSYSK